MSSETSVKVTGFKELAEFLTTLTAKMQKNVMTGGLRAGVVVVREEVKRRAPVGLPASRNVTRYGGYQGALRDSVRISVRARDGIVTATVSAGGMTKRGADVYYTRWVEYGTKPHSITSKKAHGALAIGGRFFPTVMHHGAHPQPFMRPALAASAQPAILAVGAYVKQRLATKNGLDTSDVEISIGGAE